MTNVANPWVPVPLAAQIAGRSHRTVRTWARRGIVRTTGAKGAVRVHLLDVVHESRDRQRRPSTLTVSNSA